MDVAAIVAGSVSPDFVYFLHFQLWGHYGHTWRGIWVRDLPEGLLVLFLYRWLLEPTLRLWYWPEEPVPPRRSWLATIAMAVFCVLLGIASHLLWDAFTHPDFWLYPHLAFLHRRVPLFIHHRTLSMTGFLQYASSVFGVVGIALFWWLCTHATSKRSAPPGMPPKARQLFFALLAASILVGLAYTLAAQGMPGVRIARKIFVVYTVVCSISFFGLALLAFHGVFRRLTPAPSTRGSH